MLTNHDNENAACRNGKEKGYPKEEQEEGIGWTIASSFMSLFNPATYNAEDKTKKQVNYNPEKLNKIEMELRQQENKLRERNKELDFLTQVSIQRAKNLIAIDEWNHEKEAGGTNWYDEEREMDVSFNGAAADVANYRDSTTTTTTTREEKKKKQSSRPTKQKSLKEESREEEDGTMRATNTTEPKLKEIRFSSRQIAKELDDLTKLSTTQALAAVIKKEDDNEQQQNIGKAETARLEIEIEEDIKVVQRSARLLKRMKALLKDSERQCNRSINNSRQLP